MTIYIDTDCKCYAEAAEGLREVETDFFKGKCKELIEAYRYVPLGEEWTREDGVVFYGEMVSPWKDLTEPLAAQLEYVTRQLEDADEALEVLYGDKA